MVESSVVKVKKDREDMEMPKTIQEVMESKQKVAPPEEIKPAKKEEHKPDMESMHEEELEHAASIIESIMAKRRMAKGGEILSEDDIEVSDSEQVDLSENAEEEANMLDRLNFNALRKEIYAESDALDEMDQPRDSNLKGHDMDDENDRSIVSAIRRKMKK